MGACGRCRCACGIANRPSHFPFPSRTSRSAKQRKAKHARVVGTGHRPQSPTAYRHHALKAFVPHSARNPFHYYPLLFLPTITFPELHVQPTCCFDCAGILIASPKHILPILSAEKFDHQQSASDLLARACAAISAADHRSLTTALFDFLLKLPTAA